jgi:hypothetical protein
MFTNKTIVKKPWSSMRLDQSTPRQHNHRSSTQMIPNHETVSMQHAGLTTEYKVYLDRYIGIQGVEGTDLPIIEMDADEDCETTESLLRFGTTLCVRDLQQSLLIPREQTQTNLSEASYEDC